MSKKQLKRKASKLKMMTSTPKIWKEVLNGLIENAGESTSGGNGSQNTLEYKIDMGVIHVDKDNTLIDVETIRFDQLNINIDEAINLFKLSNGPVLMNSVEDCYVHQCICTYFAVEQAHEDSPYVLYLSEIFGCDVTVFGVVLWIYLYLSNEGVVESSVHGGFFCDGGMYIYE